MNDAVLGWELYANAGNGLLSLCSNSTNQRLAPFSSCYCLCHPGHKQQEGDACLFQHPLQKTHSRWSPVPHCPSPSGDEQPEQQPALAPARPLGRPVPAGAGDIPLPRRLEHRLLRHPAALHPHRGLPGRAGLPVRAAGLRLLRQGQDGEGAEGAAGAPERHDAQRAPAAGGSGVGRNANPPGLFATRLGGAGAAWATHTQADSSSVLTVQSTRRNASKSNAGKCLKEGPDFFFPPLLRL